MPSDRAPSNGFLPFVPRIDRYGLHAEDCPCARCESGYRPSQAQRWAARKAWEREEARRKAEAQGLEVRDKKPKGRAMVARGSAAVEATRALLEKQARAAAVPLPTPEEWNELKQLRRRMFSPSYRDRRR